MSYFSSWFTGTEQSLPRGAGSQPNRPSAPRPKNAPEAPTPPPPIQPPVVGPPIYRPDPTAVSSLGARSRPSSSLPAGSRPTPFAAPPPTFAIFTPAGATTTTTSTFSSSRVGLDDQQQQHTPQEDREENDQADEHPGENGSPHWIVATEEEDMAVVGPEVVTSFGSTTNQAELAVHHPPRSGVDPEEGGGEAYPTMEEMENYHQEYRSGDDGVDPGERLESKMPQQNDEEETSGMGWAATMPTTTTTSPEDYATTMEEEDDRPVVELVEEEVEDMTFPATTHHVTDYFEEEGEIDYKDQLESLAGEENLYRENEEDGNNTYWIHQDDDHVLSTPTTNHATTSTALSNFVFLSDEKSVPQQLNQWQLHALRRQQAFACHIHDLECRIAALTGQVAQENLDRSDALQQLLHHTIQPLTEQMLERFHLDRDHYRQEQNRWPPDPAIHSSPTNKAHRLSSSSAAATLRSLEQRAQDLDTHMTHSLHVTLSTTQREHLEELRHKLGQDMVAQMKLETSKADKRQASMVRRWDEWVGTRARRFLEERAGRRAALEGIAQRLQRLRAGHLRRDDEFVAQIRELRQQLNAERAARQEKDQWIMQEIRQTAAQLKQALWETEGDPTEDLLLLE